MNIKFGKPSHGWLPVTITHEGTNYEFNASDVPVDPIGRLVVALNSLFSARADQVWWHLEPDGYYLNFKPCGDECVVSLEFSDESRKDRSDLKFQYRDNINNLVISLWRELRKFYSYGYKVPHWPSEDTKEMLTLTNHVKKLQKKD
jgi:hypothetical protein